MARTKKVKQVAVAEVEDNHSEQYPSGNGPIEGDQGQLAYNPTPGDLELKTEQAHNAMRNNYTPAQLEQNPNLF